MCLPAIALAFCGAGRLMRCIAIHFIPNILLYRYTSIPLPQQHDPTALLLNTAFGLVGTFVFDEVRVGTRGQGF